MGTVVSFPAAATLAPAASTQRPLDELSQKSQGTYDLQDTAAWGGMFTEAVAERIDDADGYSVAECFARSPIVIHPRNFLSFPIRPRENSLVLVADRHTNEVFQNIWSSSEGSSRFKHIRALYKEQKPESFGNRFGPLADILRANMGTISTSLDEIHNGVMSEGTASAFGIMKDIAALLALDAAAPEIFWKNTLVVSERKVLFKVIEALANRGFLSIKDQFIPERIEEAISALVLETHTESGNIDVLEVGQITLKDALTHIDVLAQETRLRLMQGTDETFEDYVEGIRNGNSLLFLKTIGDLTIELAKRVSSYIPDLLANKKDVAMTEDLSILLNLFDFLSRSPSISKYLVYHSLDHDDWIILAHTLYHLNDSGLGYEAPLNAFKHLLKPLRPQTRESVGHNEEITINRILFPPEEEQNILFRLAEKISTENARAGILRPSELLRSMIVTLSGSITSGGDRIKATMLEELVGRFASTDQLKNLLWWSLSDGEQELFRKALLRLPTLNERDRLKTYSAWSRLWLHVPRGTSKDESIGLTAAFGPIARAFDEALEYIKYGRVGASHPLNNIGNTPFTLATELDTRGKGYRFTLKIPDPGDTSWQEDSLFEWMRHVSQFSLYTRILADKAPNSTAFYELESTTFLWLNNLYHDSMAYFYEWRTEAYRVFSQTSIPPVELANTLREGRSLLEKLNRFEIYLHPFTLELEAIVKKRIETIKLSLIENHLAPDKKADLIKALRTLNEQAITLSAVRTQFHNMSAFRRKLNGIHEVANSGDFEAAAYLAKPKPAILGNIFDDALGLAIGDVDQRPELKNRFRVIGDTALLNGLSVEDIGFEHALLLQIIVEFDHNFSKYYDPDKESSTATFTVTKVGEEIKFHYKDTGIGMKRSTVDNIFNGAVGLREGVVSKKGLGHGLAGQIISIDRLGGRFPREEFHTIPKEEDPIHSGIEFSFYIPINRFKTKA